jgi:lipopolysaccharide transport system permease protein
MDNIDYLEAPLTTASSTFRTSRSIHNRDLLRELVSRDMKLRYKRSVLGVGWSLLNPLAQLLVFQFVFGTLLSLKVPNYTAFVFTGVLVWNWFQTSLMLVTTSIVDNRELIKRPGFPIPILPIVTVSSTLIHFLLALPVLFVLLGVTGVHFTMAVITLPLIIAMQFALTLGIAYLVATFHVTFRDTQYLLGVILQLLFFLTPVFYDVSAIPDRFRIVFQFNPVSNLLTAYRNILVNGRFPTGIDLLLLGSVAVTLVAVGYFVMRRASHQFIEEL